METKEELVTSVKEWIKIDSEITQLQNEIKGRKNKKKELSEALMNVMKKNEIECFDINGGSFRVYVQKEVASITSFGSSPLRDVCNFRIESLLNYEKNNFDISKVEVWNKFVDDIEALKKQTVDFIKKEKSLI